MTVVTFIFNLLKCNWFSFNFYKYFLVDEKRLKMWNIESHFIEIKKKIKVKNQVDDCLGVAGLIRQTCTRFCQVFKQYPEKCRQCRGFYNLTIKLL